MKKSYLLFLAVIFCMIGIISVSAQKQTRISPDMRQFKPRQVQSDRNHDGAIDRIEVYDSSGTIIRVEADSTGDGKMNEWVYYSKGKATKGEKDINGDGKADTILTYDRKGKIIKAETDSTGDSKTNEWVYYKDGKPTKAEKDTNGDGKPDTWIKY